MKKKAGIGGEHVRNPPKKLFWVCAYVHVPVYAHLDKGSLNYVALDLFWITGMATTELYICI